MSRLYSKSTGNLYLAGVNKDIPNDAIEISDELVLSVIGNPAPGKVRAHDENGLPFLVDAPPPTVEQLASIERAWRLVTDGIINRHRDEVESGEETTLTMEQYRALQGCRQGLRSWPDWPESAPFPDNIKRPIAPDWFIPPSSKPAGADKYRSACFGVCFLRIKKYRVRRSGLE